MDELSKYLEIAKLAKSFSSRKGFQTVAQIISWSILLVAFYIFINIGVTAYLEVGLSYTESLFHFIELHKKTLLHWFVPLASMYLAIWFGWNIVFGILIQQRQFTLNPRRLHKDWYFQGILKPSNNSMILSHSDSGCMIRGRDWRDYEMTFYFRLTSLQQRGFGVIIRAYDLENYIMLKLDDNITPHIRFEKFWEIIAPRDQALEICDGEWHNCKIKVENNVAMLELDDNVKNEYLIPTHSGLSPSKKENDPTIAGKLQYRESGSVGFRAWGYEGENTEKVEIKNLRISRIDSTNSLGLERQ